MKDKESNLFNLEFEKAFNKIKQKELVSEKSKIIISGIEIGNNILMYSPKNTSESFRKNRIYLGMNESIINGILAKGYVSYEDCLQWAEACLFAGQIEAAFILYEHVYSYIPESLFELYSYSFDKYKEYYEAVKGLRFEDIINDISNDMFWIDLNKYGIKFAKDNYKKLEDNYLDVYFDII